MPARLLSLIMFVSVAAGPASGQTRETICLHEAGDSVCAELVARTNAAGRRLNAIGDDRTRKICRSVLAEQFHRDCAQRVLAHETADRGCYAVFRRFERNLARHLQRVRSAGIDTGPCS